MTEQERLGEEREERDGEAGRRGGFRVRGRVEEGGERREGGEAGRWGGVEDSESEE